MHSKRGERERKLERENVLNRGAIRMSVSWRPKEKEQARERERERERERGRGRAGEVKGGKLVAQWGYLPEFKLLGQERRRR